MTKAQRQLLWASPHCKTVYGIRLLEWWALTRTSLVCCLTSKGFGSPATVVEMLSLTVPWNSVEPAAGKCREWGGQSRPLGTQGTVLGPVSAHPYEDPADQAGRELSLLLNEQGH